MSLRDISGVLQSLTNLEKVKITEEELERKSQEKNRLLGIQFKAKEAQKNYSLTQDNLKNRREENEDEIKSLVNEIKTWNIVAEDWSTLDDSLQTDDGKAILDSLGVVYNDNFNFKEKLSTDYNEQLNFTGNVIKMQDLVINDLNSKLNSITRLEEDWLKVGTDAANKGIKDVEDVLAYIEADTSGVDGRSKFLNEDGTPNYLARALMKVKEYPTDTGFIDNSEIDAALTKITENKELADELEEKEFASNLEFSFQEIGSTEDLLDSDDDMFKTMGGKVASYKGNKDLYADENIQKQLMQSVQDKIKKIFEYSNEGRLGGIFGTSRDWRNSSVMEAINAMEGQSFENQRDLMDKIYNDIMPDPTKNETLYGSGNKIWSSPTMEEIDLVSGNKNQQTQEDLLKQYLTVWGKLNNKLYSK